MDIQAILKRAQTASRKEIAIAAASLIGVVAIGLGFNSDIYKVKHCVATVKKYVMAEYSETTTESCTDANGNSSLCTSTDYWEERASQVFTVNTVDGVAQSEPNSRLHEAGYPSMPQPDKGMAASLDFDRFSRHTDESLNIQIENDAGSDIVSKSISFNPHCIKTIGLYTIVRNWYGFNYSVRLPDFDQAQ